MHEPETLAEQRRQQLRQLSHDIKTHLAVVSMGIEALKGVRNDDAVFAQVHEMIRKDGIDPLKEIVTALLNLVRELESCPPPE